MLVSYVPKSSFYTFIQHLEVDCQPGFIVRVASLLRIGRLSGIRLMSYLGIHRTEAKISSSTVSTAGHYTKVYLQPLSQATLFKAILQPAHPPLPRPAMLLSRPSSLKKASSCLVRRSVLCRLVPTVGGSCVAPRAQRCRCLYRGV